MKFVKEDFGKLFIRVILGVLLSAKGVIFFVYGQKTLVALGKMLSIIGVNTWPLFFGWAIAIVCLICGITFLLGAFFKTTTFLLGSVSLLEAVFKYFTGGSFMEGVFYSVILAATMYGFMLIGAGTYSVQK